ncbi:MAG: hypothetical protein U5K37_08070 [Natrialbaceae archaeon]|nr:hypothetical protein [Natrialbaceae archaeon]
MFLEAPVDAWYGWLGAAILSVGLAGMAVALPTTPPPDATGAANALEAVAASPGSTVTYSHQAESSRFGRTTLSLRNDGGVSHAEIAFGRIVPAAGNERLVALVAGATPATIYGNRSAGAWRELLEADIERVGSVTAGWTPSTGTLRARSLSVDGQTVVFVDE